MTRYPRQPIVSFDVDKTLVQSFHNLTPIEKNVELLKRFKRGGAKVIVWSRGGKAHAEKAGKRIGLKGVVYKSKNVPHQKPDISVDDKEHDLGKVNIKA
jgi:predicted HAD superfamily phosphohydrolase YqeG